MLYQYAIPLALPQHDHVDFMGAVVYEGDEVTIPSSAVDRAFVNNAVSLIRRLAAEEPPQRVPSPQECRWCEIGAEDCPDRVSTAAVEGETTDF